MSDLGSETTPSASLKRPPARKKLGKRNESFQPNDFLPEDLLLDILIRLPTKDVLRFRRVCKRWKEITSTTDFLQLHRRRFGPVIIKDRPLAFLDKCWEPTQTRSKIQKVFADSIAHKSMSGMFFSQNGLISYADKTLGDGNFVISNPIYRENVKIRVPMNQYKAEIYGVYFDSLLKEYCTLWRMTSSYYLHYRVLNLGANPQCIEIKKNPSTENARISDLSPVLVDEKYLYWIVEPTPNYKHDCVHMEIVSFHCNIVEFDTGSHEFRVLKGPVPLSVKLLCYNLKLFDIDGVLSLIKIDYVKEVSEITIWRMEDRMEQSWRSCRYDISGNLYPVYGIPQPVALWNGEVVLLSGRRLYVCNLEWGTTRKFGQKYRSDVTFLSHMINLVPLKDSKPMIQMEEEEEE